MADRYDYEDRERRRGRREDEGFFDRVRDWFGGQEDEDYDNNERGRSFDRNRDPGNPRYDVNFSRGGGNRDNWQRDQNYERSRQWRGSGQGSEYDRRPEYTQSQNRDAFGDAYGQNYGSDWNLDQGGEDYDWDYGYSRQYNRGEDFGRNYNPGSNQDFNRGNNRDWEMNQGRRSGRIYNRDWYDWDFDEENDFNRNSGYNSNRGGMRDYGSRERFNRGSDDYNQLRDYGRGSNLGGARTYNQGSEYNRSRDYNRDQEYGMGRDYNRGRDYDRGRDYNQGRDYHLYGLDYGPERDKERSRNYDRSYNRGSLYGLQNTPSRVNYKYGGREDQDWSNQYRTAGLNSDYGQRSDYENRAFYDENLDFYRGDVGYDEEGAFYQDLDEPINYEYWEFWEVPGPYSGIGPQNFERSDKRIKEDVCERFTNHGRIDASDIEIDVTDGEVTLRGTVPDREMKRLAEDTAEDITGVKNIHNEIKVNKPDWSQRGYNRSSERGYNRDYGRNRDRAETSMAGQTNAGSGLTGESATSLSGMEAATSEDQKSSQLREGMEVIGNTGQVIGRVKAIRTSDFLVDREMARDLYVPFSAIKSVGAQVLLNVAHDQVDQQDWEKPNAL